MSTQLTRADCAAVLGKLEVQLRASKHYIAGFIYVDGVRALAVHIALIPDPIPGQIGDRFRRSLLVALDEFNLLRQCKMSRLEWVDLVKGRLSSAAD